MSQQIFNALYYFLSAGVFLSRMMNHLKAFASIEKLDFVEQKDTGFEVK